MKIPVGEFVRDFDNLFAKWKHLQPWELTRSLPQVIEQIVASLDANEYRVRQGVAVHRTAVVESNVVLKAPVIVSERCFIAANAYLRSGVYLGENSRVGPGCEIKQSVVMSNSTVAHFNFVGDSIVGNDVNIEAGAVFANRYNERDDKRIFVWFEGTTLETNSEKFGALVGDGSRVGANAMLSAGTILSCNSVVRRLELVEQLVR